MGCLVVAIVAGNGKFSAMEWCTLVGGLECNNDITWICGLYILYTLGWLVLSIIEKLSCFRGVILPLDYGLVHQKVSFIRRCPLSEAPLLTSNAELAITTHM